ncbi:MAG TPA: DUF1810 family protein [Chthoniobacterales bacterium]|nr:DUF1810 family protein [Chthoniobacterales bacterium]
MNAPLSGEAAPLPSCSSMSLERFHEAQTDPHTGYDTALAEIRRRRKTSHWIWYVFPQLADLGRSAMAGKCDPRSRGSV